MRPNSNAYPFYFGWIFIDPKLPFLSGVQSADDSAASGVCSLYNQYVPHQASFLVQPLPLHFRRGPADCRLQIEVVSEPLQPPLEFPFGSFYVDFKLLKRVFSFTKCPYWKCCKWDCLKWIGCSVNVITSDTANWTLIRWFVPILQGFLNELSSIAKYLRIADFISIRNVLYTLCEVLLEIPIIKL